MNSNASPDIPSSSTARSMAWPGSSEAFDPDRIRPRTIEELRALDGIKWSHYGDDVVSAWVADMDLRPPDLVTAAIAQVLERGDLGYNFDASGRLPAAFSAWQQARHGWVPDPDEMTLFASVLHAVDVLLWITTEPGDGIVLFTPIYPPFRSAVAGSGRRLVDVPLERDGWRLDPDRLRAAIDERTRVILFCNPHNPTGRTFTVEECRAVAEVAVEHDLLVISDEVWGDLVHPEGRHRPMATAIADPELAGGLAERLVTLSSGSKTFNLAGLRCAVGHVSSPLVRKRLDELPAHLLGGTNTPAAVATLACWTEGEGWYRNLLRWLTDRRDQLAARLAADLPAVRFDLPESTYLAWLDLGAYGIGPDPGRWLLDRARIALNPGLDFGPNGEGFVRMNLATSPEIVDLLVDRMAEVLTEL